MAKKKRAPRPDKTGEAAKRPKQRYDVVIGEPKPNKMFSEVQHAITKFLTYTRRVACADCGKKRKRHWTQLFFFRVMEDAAFVFVPSETLYPPLTPVCTDHVLGPEMEEPA